MVCLYDPERTKVGDTGLQIREGTVRSHIVIGAAGIGGVWKTLGTTLTEQEVDSQRDISGSRESARYVLNVIVQAAIFVDDHDCRNLSSEGFSRQRQVSEQPACVTGEICEYAFDVRRIRRTGIGGLRRSRLRYSEA